jgi:hypothetical protein
MVLAHFPKDNAMCTVNNNFLFVVLELDGSTLIDRVYKLIFNEITRSALF